jgi:hypothetical protein
VLLSILFDVSVDLHSIDEKKNQSLSDWKEKWIVYAIKAYLFHDLYFYKQWRHLSYLIAKLSINTRVHFLACSKYVCILFPLLTSRI